MKSESIIPDLAANLARDVSPLGTVEISTVGLDVSLKNASFGANSEGKSNYLDSVIRLIVSNEWRLDVVFYTTPSLEDQMLNGVSEIQDCVSEDTQEPWPRCPIHYHMMIVEVQEGEFVWVCPEDPNILFAVGSLNA